MREEKEFATTGKQKVSVREETNAVSDTRVMIVKNRHQKPLHPLSHHHQEVGVRREERSLRGRSPSGKTNRQPCKNLLKGTCTKLPCDYWHPPGCQFYQFESGCNFGTDCSFPHWKVEEQPSKRTRKGGDKGSCNSERCATGLRIAGRRAGQHLQRLHGRAQNFCDQFDEYDSQELRSVKQTSEKTKVHR